jgi:hypothetical protein
MEDGSNCTLWGRRERTVDRREKKITSPGFRETTLPNHGPPKRYLSNFSLKPGGVSGLPIFAVRQIEKYSRSYKNFPIFEH